IEPRATIMGEGVERLPNTTCLTMPGVDSQTQVMAFDLAGVGISAGSACSSGKTKASGVLKAMSMSDEVAGCAVRVSLGWSSTADDVTTFLAAWNDLYDRQAKHEISSPAA
ncbi:MAG: aminotransferase class V-fold PLP-dependent enzyme, partial [Rhodospirillaceae bacterium]|nr:aminotransferase class V-fold PLP-dependent enzyme [Rhodospirillaceae bacterium]